MAELTTHCYDKALKSTIKGMSVYLYKSWDLAHGWGWFCHSYNMRFAGFGFHKKSKFRAVKMALGLK